MKIEERLRLIKHLDYLIKSRFRGKSAEYANKLNISRSAFFRLLYYVKTQLDAPICYCKTNGYYEYCKSGIMHFGFLPDDIFTEEAKKKYKIG